MFHELFDGAAWAEALPIIRGQFLTATWETLLSSWSMMKIPYEAPTTSWTSVPAPVNTADI